VLNVLSSLEQYSPTYCQDKVAGGPCYHFFK